VAERYLPPVRALSQVGLMGPGFLLTRPCKEFFACQTRANTAAVGKAPLVARNRSDGCPYITSTTLVSNLFLSAQLWIFSFAGPLQRVGGTSERKIR